MADFAADVQAQSQVDALYKDPTKWAQRALINVAGMGAFSADRTIGEYVDRVWSIRAQ
jgi:starch phosphorylase